MGQLGKRLLSSAVFVAVSLFAIFLGPDWFFFIFIEVFILVALYEYFGICQKKGISVHLKLGLSIGALIPAAAYFHSEFMFILLAVIVLFIFHFQVGKQTHALGNISVTVFGVIYIAWFCSFLIKSHQLENGSWWVFYTILLAKGGDAGAYFIGKKFGKEKLIPHISPHKSVEGALGGFAATVLLALPFIFILHISFFHTVVLGILVAVISLVGDLGESVLKRDGGLKDSGQVPGLGGVLDVLDSLTLSIPFVYYYATVILHVGERL